MALLTLQTSVNRLACDRPSIAAGVDLQVITGVSVIANFVGEHNAMPTRVATQAALLAIATGSIVSAQVPRFANSLLSN